jgi:predicted PP-loop superfamily ATPase
MRVWLDLPERSYKPAVYLFAQRLPAVEVLAAVEIARAKIPQGSVDGFKYFCGICHSKIRERKIQLSWN